MKEKFKTVQLTKWPEHLLPWKMIRAEALKRNKTVTQLVYDILVQWISKEGKGK